MAHRGMGESCALLHLCIFVEAHFLDKSLYARIYGNDVLLHLRIFGKFHVAEVHKFCAHPNDGALKICFYRHRFKVAHRVS